MPAPVKAQPAKPEPVKEPKEGKFSIFDLDDDDI